MFASSEPEQKIDALLVHSSGYRFAVMVELEISIGMLVVTLYVNRGDLKIFVSLQHLEFETAMSLFSCFNALHLFAV